MCGITGSSPSRPELVYSCLSRLSARGPDSHAIVDTGTATIGASRLAITDLVHGDQPLTSKTGQTHIAFNGALYNANKLVLEYDLEVATGNDAEVALALYEQFGPCFTDELDGMYAFVIADETLNSVCFGVDEVGIKPLYVARWPENGLLLCSTLQALDRNWLGQAERVPPGTVWNTTGLLHRTGSGFGASPGVPSWTTALEQAVRGQIPDQVAWGCLLSGGIDSSVVTLLARDAARESIVTLSCGIPGSADILAARKAADLLGTVHLEHLIDPSQLRDLAVDVVEATASFEPWLVLGGIGTLAASRAAAANGIKVLLSGEGADELFAGYRDFDRVPAGRLEHSLRDQQDQLGATECLRLDRCSMAAGVEARVPFLARDVVRAVRGLPVAAKRDRPGDPSSTSKVALRRYASDLGLPDEVAYRPKVGFSMGTGVGPWMNELALTERGNWADRIDRRRYAAPGVDMDSPTSAWLLGRWLERYGDALAPDWTSLAARGIVRA